MELILSDITDESEEKQIIDDLWGHNHQFSPVNIHPLKIAVKDLSGKIKGGIIARTWWGGLDIQYLWVADEYRGRGNGRKLMMMAENEAVNRGCHFAYVDTLSFQASNFYEKLGYLEYGSLNGFAHKFSRHYLFKKFRQ